jgi:hypothetical protein
MHRYTLKAKPEIKIYEIGITFELFDDVVPKTADFRAALENQVGYKGDQGRFHRMLLILWPSGAVTLPAVVTVLAVSRFTAIRFVDPISLLSTILRDCSVGKMPDNTNGSQFFVPSPNPHLNLGKHGVVLVKGD